MTAIAVPLLVVCAASAAEDRQPPVETARYGGRTLAEWRERVKQLDFSHPDIGEEVPGLLAIVEDQRAPWYSRRQAALTLGRIGAPAAEAVPVMIGLIDEHASDVEQSAQLWAIKSLALFGPVAAEAAPALAQLLVDESQPALPRLAAIEALGRIGPARPEVLPAILNALQAGLTDDATADADRLERAIAAAEMLELFGGNASAAVPSLIRATASRSVLLRRAAANTLGLIGPAADPAVPALVDLVLFDESEEVRDLAARALGRIGPAAEPSLVQLLRDRDAEVRVRAARAMRELPSFSPETAAALAEASGDAEADVRIMALESVWTVTADAAAVAQGALTELTHADRDTRMRAVRLLESMGTALDRVLPALQSLAEDRRPYVAQAARRVLRTYETQAERLEYRLD